MTVLNIHFTKVLLLKECCMSTNPNLWHCLWKKINVNDRKWFFIMTVTINLLWYLGPMSLNLCEKQTIVRSSSIFFLTWILFYSCGCASKITLNLFKCFIDFSVLHIYIYIYINTRSYKKSCSSNIWPLLGTIIYTMDSLNEFIKTVCMTKILPLTCTRKAISCSFPFFSTSFLIAWLFFSD